MSFRWFHAAIRFGVVFFTALEMLAGSDRSKPLAWRAAWLHRGCNLALRRLNIRVEVDGEFPPCGLIVSNHLSYLDILVFSSIAPCVFVSKIEVRDWPIFGKLADAGGTVFVDRNRTIDVHRVKDEMQNALSAGVVVVLFPEGTSTNGSEVLPFKPALLQSAVASEQPCHATYLRYTASAGDVANDVCWWGNEEFAPHFIRLLQCRDIVAHVRFSSTPQHFTDRKEAALKLRGSVLALQSEH